MFAAGRGRKGVTPKTQISRRDRAALPATISAADLRKKVRRSESAIVTAACQYLRARGKFFWRQNNNAVYDRTKEIFRKFSQYAMPGVPDIILIDFEWLTSYHFKHKVPKIFALEGKTEVGQQSPEQKEFQKQWEARGGKYLIFRSVDDLMKAGL